MGSGRMGWGIAALAGLALVGMLGFYGPPRAVSQPPRMPFSNAVEQRSNMIQELRQIRRLLEEQNRILRLLASRPDSRELPPSAPTKGPSKRPRRHR